MNKIKNVIFDMGGVLLDYDPIRIVKQVSTDKAEIQSIIDVTFGCNLWDEYDRGVVTLKEIYDAAIKKTPQSLHKKIKLSLENWDKYFIEIDGAESFISKLKKNGYSMFLLSNTGEKFHEFRHTEKILEHFDKFIVSCDIKVNKPDKEIYEALINKFKLEPSQSIFIDDRLQNVEGAKSIGMESEQFMGYDNLIKAFKEKYCIIL